MNRRLLRAAALSFALLIGTSVDLLALFPASFVPSSEAQHLKAPLPSPSADIPAAASSEQEGRIAEQVLPGSVPPKAAVDGLDGPLSSVALLAQRGEWSQLQSVAQEQRLSTKEGLIQAVVLKETAADADIRDMVLQAGGRIETSYGSLLQVAVPAGTLDRLAHTPGVLSVTAPQHPLALDTLSEGRTGMGLEPWIQAGMRGQGVRIAIVDVGFDGYWNILGSDLPAQVTVRSFRTDGDITGGGDLHGTAAAEIVYDIAPDASLYLANFSTEVELGAAVDWLTSQNVHIISSSVGWPGTAYGDGKGTVNEIVKKAESHGILWVQAAGNFGQTHWTGLFTDPDGNGFNNFGPNDEGNTITLRRVRPNEERIYLVEVFLTWDDWDCLCQDYDVFLFRGDAVVAQSTAFQNGKAPPLEHIVYTTASTGDYWIGVQRFRANRRVKLDVTVTIDYGMEYKTPSESLVVPADSPFALTVGAVEANTLDVRPYSSQGPTKDGRMKPDLVAADQVSTTSYGLRGFPGTSAAAPHVAGAAALYKGARPSLSPAQLRAELLQRAVGAGQSGKNNAVGAGRVFMGDIPGRLFLPLVPSGVLVP